MTPLHDSLRTATAALGGGFLAANPPLRQALASGQLTPDDYGDELARLTLQLLVVAIAEGRDLLVKATASSEQRQFYARHCALAALGEAPPTAEHPDSIGLWRARATVLEQLALVHGTLFARTPGRWGAGFLRDHALRNADLRDAAVWLLDLPDLAGWGAPELGAAREVLLELTPKLDGERFTVRRRGARRRLDAGVYYTPPPAVEGTLNLALDPLIERYSRPQDPGNLLRIQVIDPACGAGVFLVAAARRLAARYATLLAGAAEPPAAAVRFALPVVMQECIFGVDIDPVAVALARVALWLEVAPARAHPMSFIDDNVICGNPLAGDLPEALREHAGEATSPTATLSPDGVAAAVRQAGP
jgi:MmeI, DNA-methyltransferase domain